MIAFSGPFELPADSASVGFYRDGTGLRVTLPKAYAAVLPKLDSDRTFGIGQVALLIRLLAQYRRRHSHRFVGTDAQDSPRIAELVETGDLLDVLEAAVDLRHDYYENGLYPVKERDQVSTEPTNNVNWRQTIARKAPLFLDDSVLYMDPDYRRRRRTPNDFFSQLHARAVAESLRLLGDTLHVPDEAMLEIAAYLEIAADPPPYLDRYRYTLFRDRGRELLGLLYVFLNQAGEWQNKTERSEPLFCRVSEFELIWEEMLRSLFDNREERGLQRFPVGKWLNVREAHVDRGVTPRPDIIRVTDGSSPRRARLFLIDAKDKPIAAAGQISCSEADHYKQILYAQLQAPRDSRRIENLLMLPTMDASLVSTERPFHILGAHWWAGLAQSLVFEIAVHYETIAKAYLREISLDVESVFDDLLTMLSSAHRAMHGHQ